MVHVQTKSHEAVHIVNTCKYTVNIPKEVPRDFCYQTWCRFRMFNHSSPNNMSTFPESPHPTQKENNNKKETQTENRTCST